jgi:hypothetical protein
MIEEVIKGRIESIHILDGLLGRVWGLPFFFEAGVNASSLSSRFSNILKSPAINVGAKRLRS